MRNYLGLALVDRYIINQLMPILIFSLFICTIICELVGISFEQAKFVITEGLPINIALQVHLLKLPAFICEAIPLALLIATIILYSKLSIKSEIIALQSYGISLSRSIAPTMAIALTVAILMFSLQELVVPVSNYQAAMVLEREWQVDRTQLAKYNKREIIYQKYSQNSQQPHLEFLFFASRFDGIQMLDITLLRYRDGSLREIITSQTAQSQEKRQLWQLSNGDRYILNKDGSYGQIIDFERLTIKLDKNILEYANYHQDLREMNLLELYRRLNIIEHTNNIRNLERLKISIQKRYALPCSGLVFAFLGSVLGITTGAKTKSNSLGIAAILVMVYYCLQFIAITLTTMKIIPIFLGVWMPNLLGLFLGYYIYFYSSEKKSPFSVILRKNSNLTQT